MDNVTIVAIALVILTFIIIVIVLNIMQSHRTKKLKVILDKLDVEKNEIDSSPIIPELSKIESILKNEKLEAMYNDWKNRLYDIKNEQIPKITDMLLEADYSLSKMDYKNTLYKIAKLEMEIYKVRTNSEFLLKEIKEITTSEERSRAIITKLKATYRELYQKFTDTKHEFGEIAKPITLQFENIAKRFEDFEQIMDANDYLEVNKVTSVISDMLKHMEVVMEEMPSIVLLATNVLPTKINECLEQYNHMVELNYPLDYLNVEYNVSEAQKKISDILDRSRVLNLEDSLFELKVLHDYFDSLFNDFEKEKVNRQVYVEANNSFENRLIKLNGLVKDIFTQIETIHEQYNLNESDLNALVTIREDLLNLNNDYKILSDHTGNNTFAYSKLTKEIENLSARLSAIEEQLDTALDAIGSMKEDEVRARQQLDEVKVILKEAQEKIGEYNLPIIPKSYYVELNEAQEAIKEIVRELEKKPITISVLNTRVDTARDLVLKLFTRSKELVKFARLAEIAIIYANRYRSSISDLDKHLTYSESFFFKGEYQKSLELTVNALNRIEPGIYNRLLKYSEKN